MKNRICRALAGLALCLGQVSLGMSVDVQGFKTDKEFKTETTRKLPLQTSQVADSSNFWEPSSIALRPSDVIPEWVSQSKAAKGACQVCYQVELIPGRSSILILDLVSNASCVKRQPTALMVLAHRDQCSIRLLFDINDNHSFEPDEIREATFTDGIQNNGPPGSGQAVMYFPLAGLSLPNSQSVGIKAAVALNFNWNVLSPQMSSQSQFREIMPIQLQFSPAPTAQLDTPNGPSKLKVTSTFDGKTLRISGYRLLNANNQPNYVRYGPRGQAPFSDPLDKPFRFAGKWWIITEIDPAWSTLTMAEPGAWIKDVVLDVGDQAPGWIRPDLITRHIFDPSDFRGKYLVLCYPGNTDLQIRYQGFVQMASKLRQAAGDKVRVVFVEDNNFQMEVFMRQAAGTEELPYSLIMNRDSGNYEQSNTLTSLFQVPEGVSFTTVIGPQRTILFRETEPLTNVIDKVFEILPADQSEAKGHQAAGRTGGQKKTGWWPFRH